MFSIYYLSKPAFLYCCFLTGLFGAAMGSFLNCAAWRISHGESFLKGRSRCPVCGHTLGVRDLVPVFSWLFLRGRCRHCGARISPRYVITECAFALVSVLCLLGYDVSVPGLRNYVFLCCLYCLSLVDMDSFIIPDGCLIISALAWFIALPWTAVPLGGYLARHILAALLYGGGTLALSLVMDRVLRKESLGGGDVKLFALMGLYLGLVSSLFALLFACLMGLLFAAVTGNGKGKPFPFGPAISAACAYMLLFGQPLSDWYLRLLGL